MGWFGDDEELREARPHVAEMAEAANEHARHLAEERARQERELQAREAHRAESIDSSLLGSSYAEVAKTLADGYDTNAQGKANPRQKPNKKIGDLTAMSPEERMQALGELTQNQAGDPGSEAYCGATTMIAAAMMGGGNEGLVKLINQLQADGDPKDEKKKAELEALVERASKGELDTKDLTRLTRDLDGDLREREIDIMVKTGNYPDTEEGRKAAAAAVNSRKTSDADPTGEHSGRGANALDSFMKESTLDQYLIDSEGHQRMVIDRIGVNPKDPSGQNHYVLKMNAGEGAGQKYRHHSDDDGFNAVFDPYQRKDGHQVTRSADNPELMKTYMQASSDGFRVDGRYTAAEGYGSLYPL